MKKFIVLGISILLISSILAVSVSAQDQETGFSKFVFWLWDKIKPLITGEVVSIVEEPIATILDFASVVNLTNANVTFNGINEFDFSGRSVGSGDFNNDSVDDVIIGASDRDSPGKTDAGESYIFFGPFNSGSTIELSAANVTFNGIDASDFSGTSVGSGDFNNDSVDDVIIGAFGGDPSGKSFAGESYIVFGPFNSGSTIELSAANVTFNGINIGDNSGRSVGSGDFNNDSVDDVIIGATGGDPPGRTDAGESYIVFGPFNSGSTIELSAANVTFNGIATEDFSSSGVGSGDFNNDGVDDVIIGDGNRDSPGKTDAGESYIVFGPFNSGSTIELNESNVTFNGIDASDFSGGGVGSGDFNNDGVDDVIIGAFGGDPSGKSFAGESYIVFGPFNSGSTIELSAANVTFNGIDASDFSGGGVGSGDFNNDSVDDVIIGAVGGNPSGKSFAGESYIVFGSVPPPPSVCKPLNTPDSVETLKNNVNSSGTCFTISANNVTLDCDGFLINGIDTAGSYGVDNTGGFDNVTIKNCVISNFTIGVYFTNGADEGTIINNTANSNSINGIYLISSSNNNLINNTANSNTNDGIQVRSSSNNNLINNTANSNTNNGIYLASSSNNNLINNIANLNTRDGIRLFSGSNNNLTSNTANSNTINGIHLFGSSSNNNLINNTADSNIVQGISLSTSSNNSLINNAANLNGVN